MDESFLIRKKNGKIESLVIKKNKLFLTHIPLLNEAIKFGNLCKYQESIFSATFHEKLVVLTTIGLMYFDEYDKPPKSFIPVIGSSIKYLEVRANELLYCFRLKTYNEEVYIFGTNKKREIFGWLKEYDIFKKNYRNK